MAHPLLVDWDSRRARPLPQIQADRMVLTDDERASLTHCSTTSSPPDESDRCNPLYAHSDKLREAA